MLYSIEVNSVDDQARPDNRWAARILDIRTHVSSHQVWFKVAWFYSSSDVIQSINEYYSGKESEHSEEHKDICNILSYHTSPNERFLSNDTAVLQSPVSKCMLFLYFHLLFNRNSVFRHNSHGDRLRVSRNSCRITRFRPRGSLFSSLF